MKLSERISWLQKTIQENLFPHLRECLNDPLTEKQKDLIMILEVVEIEKYVAHLNNSWAGRPPEDRCPLARSFVAKAVYNLDNTRMLSIFCIICRPYGRYSGLYKETISPLNPPSPVPLQSL